MFYCQTFFPLQICSLLDCSKQLPGKKSGVTLLVSSQTAVKGGHGFEIAVRMDNLRGGDLGEIHNNAHRVGRDEGVLRLHVKEGYFFTPPKRVSSPT